MAILKGQLIDNSTGDILYPQTSLEMIEGKEEIMMKSDVVEIDVVDPMTTTEAGFAADAKKTRDAINTLNGNINVRYNPDTDMIEVYYNGKWNPSVKANMQSMMLYNRGEDNTAVTGGWNGYAYKAATSGASVAAPTVTNSSDGMRVSLNSSSTVGGVWTGKAIDLTNYSAIKVTCDIDAAGEFYLGLSAMKENNYTATVKISVSSDCVMDISNITGSYYILFQLYRTTATIYSIELIK